MRRLAAARLRAIVPVAAARAAYRRERGSRAKRNQAACYRRRCITKDAASGRLRTATEYPPIEDLQKGPATPFVTSDETKTARLPRYNAAKAL